MTVSKRLFGVSEYNYTRRADDKPIINMLTWNFSEALQEAKRQCARFPGKDGINESTTDKSYNCCFNWGHGQGTTTIAVMEITADSATLECDAPLKIILDFLKSNNVEVPSSVSRKEHLCACASELIRDEPNCAEKLKDMLLQYEELAKPTVCVEHASRKSTCSLTKAVIPVGSLRIGVGKLGPRRDTWYKKVEPAIEYKWYRYDTVFCSADKLYKNNNLLATGILRNPAKFVGFDELTAEEQTNLQRECQEFHRTLSVKELFLTMRQPGRKRKYTSE